MTNFSLNILPFEHPIKEKKFYFLPDYFQGSFKFHISKLPEEAKDLFPKQTKKSPYLYTNFRGHPTGKKPLTIKLPEHPSFSLIYYKWMSHKYLRSVARLSKPNFLDNNEYWFLEETADTYWLFKRFTVRVQMERATNKPELLISYNGISKIWKQNLEELTSLGIDTHSYGQVLYNKKLMI